MHVALLCASKGALLPSGVPTSEDDVAAVDSLGADRQASVGLLYNLPLDGLHAELFQRRRLHRVLGPNERKVARIRRHVRQWLAHCPRFLTVRLPGFRQHIGRRIQDCKLLRYRVRAVRFAQILEEFCPFDPLHCVEYSL